MLLALSFTSCSKDDNKTVTPDVYKVSATMSSANEVPVNSSTASGTVTGSYDAGSNTLSYKVAWTGLTGTASAGHFHSPAAAGVNAAPLVFFLLQNNGTSGTAEGSAQLSDAQEADLLAGKFYANIHTTVNSGGEIRGQVSAVK